MSDSFRPGESYELAMEMSYELSIVLTLVFLLEPLNSRTDRCRFADVTSYERPLILRQSMRYSVSPRRTATSVSLLTRSRLIRSR